MQNASNQVVYTAPKLHNVTEITPPNSQKAGVASIELTASVAGIKKTAAKSTTSTQKLPAKPPAKRGRPTNESLQLKRAAAAAAAAAAASTSASSDTSTSSVVKSLVNQQQNKERVRKFVPQAKQVNSTIVSKANQYTPIYSSLAVSQPPAKKQKLHQPPNRQPQQQRINSNISNVSSASTLSELSSGAAESMCSLLEAAIKSTPQINQITGTVVPHLLQQQQLVSTVTAVAPYRTRKHSHLYPHQQSSQHNGKKGNASVIPQQGHISSSTRNSLLNPNPLWQSSAAFTSLSPAQSQQILQQQHKLSRQQRRIPNVFGPSVSQQQMHQYQQRQQMYSYQQQMHIQMMQQGIVMGYSHEIPFEYWTEFFGMPLLNYSVGVFLFISRV
ncbi:hypothetical protein HK100_000142 [Physocladia obscura]|uniref:Uncharacterized protein n=1 Tax=Physocladia obscura TaxID=109957 RepID=A0AAD5SYX2_9FUNG|nr:hypothetical protein HK100_000142 [Physocladia obscura]